VDKKYGTSCLIKMIEDISNLIDSNILYTVSHQFQPYGASAAALISESHIAIHTYPDVHPTKPLGIIRLDIDISGCGKVSPLNSLDYLLTTLNPHLTVVDYKERGFSYDGSTKEFGERRDVNQYVKNLKKYYIQTRDQAQVLMLSRIGNSLIKEEVKEIRNGI
jgi:S-adenosylmethionine/arginine decarboxylase-like enzyme